MSLKWEKEAIIIDKALFKAALVRKGITQNELAKSMNMTKNTISNKVNGHTKVMTDEAIEMCTLLGIEDPAEKARIFLTKNSQKWDGRR